MFPSRKIRRLAARLIASLTATVLCVPAGAATAVAATAPDEGAWVRQVVDETMRPMIAEQGVPGLAVAVTIDGRRHFMEYGVASRERREPVTRETLFELGSISKTFTATLAAYAEAQGALSLADSVSKHMPELKGSALDRVRLLDLATHTAGGFPLQLPGTVRTNAQLVAYFRAWVPQAAPGTSRSYANPGIGLLGVATAKAMGHDFRSLMERRLLPELGLKRTYVKVPAGEMTSYAFGYDKLGKPVRVGPAMLADEAYGVKSNSLDMVRFLEANMGIGAVSPELSRAFARVQTGYFRAGPLIQDMIWEQYPYPASLEALLAGNSPKMVLDPVPASAIAPPLAPQGDAILNKTGSTNGFGAYTAFIPARRIGIVMLANKNYPNAARVTAAHRILSRLAP